MLDDNMAYIQIVEFDDVTIDQFTDALATVKGSDMKGLILDLRGNPGGSLDAVVQIARKLLPEGMIVYTEDKAGKRTEYTCDGKTPLEVPLVVLVDMNSASASEILAAPVLSQMWNASLTGMLTTTAIPRWITSWRKQKKC